MKAAIVLVVLGLIGIGQYVYFQFTPLAYRYVGHMPGGGVVWERDWMAGIGGAVIGAVLLGFGIHRFRRCRAS